MKPEHENQVNFLCRSIDYLMTEIRDCSEDGRFELLVAIRDAITSCGVESDVAAFFECFITDGFTLEVFGEYNGH